MRKSSFLFIFIFALIGLMTACRPTPSKTRREWTVMGTIAGVTVRGEGAANDVDAVQAAARDAFAAVNRDLSAWTDTSALARVNRLAGTPERTTFTNHLEILRMACRLARESGGAFNPLVGPAMRLWGFNGADVPETPPARSTLDALPTRLADLEFADGGTAGTLRLAREGMRLDLGAIAKGGAVDRAWHALAASPEARDALLDLGGNLRVLGGTWRTAVRDPFARHDYAAIVALTNGEAVATSGSYERFVEIGGVRYSHILDGRTLAPAAGVAGVTVVHPTSAGWADGLSTTLFVLGPEAGCAFLRRHHPEAQALWITDDVRSPRIIATPALAKRLENAVYPIAVGSSKP